MRSPFGFDLSAAVLLTQGQVRKRIETAIGGRVARRTFDRWIKRGEFPGPDQTVRRGCKGVARLWRPATVERGIGHVLQLKSAGRGELVARLGHARQHRDELRDLGRLAYELVRAGELRDELERIGCNAPLSAIPRGRRAAARAEILRALASQGARA